MSIIYKLNTLLNEVYEEEMKSKDNYKLFLKDSYFNEDVNIDYYKKFKENMNRRKYDFARYYLNKITNENDKKKAIDEFNKVRKSSKPYNEHLIINAISKVIKSLNGNKYTKYLEKSRDKNFPHLKQDLSNIHMICKIEKIKLNKSEDNEQDYYISIQYIDTNVDQDIVFATTDYIEKPILDELAKLSQFISVNFGDGDEGSMGIFNEDYDQKKWYE